jgi:hypothetical protein
MKNKLLAVVLTVLMLLAVFPVSALACNYKDIHHSWYTEAVVKYGYNDVFSGSGGKFNPNKKVTRIEFAMLLHKALGITINYFAAPDIADSFGDMKNTDTGASALNDLVTAGIVEKGGTFSPNMQLDRDVMVHWIMNALNYKSGGTYPIPMVKAVPFKDDGKITDAYRSQVYSAVTLKLVGGRGHYKFCPRQAATRAEAVAVVARLVDLLNASSAPASPSVSVAAAEKEKDGALVMTLTIKNASAKAVTITHTSGQKYDFQLLDINGAPLYTWSADKSFIMTLGATVLNPGQSAVFTETVDKSLYSLLKPGVVSMRAFIVGSSADFTIDPDGYAMALS